MRSEIHQTFDNTMEPYFYDHFSRLYKLLYKKSFTVESLQETASASMEHITKCSGRKGKVTVQWSDRKNEVLLHFTQKTTAIFAQSSQHFWGKKFCFRHFMHVVFIVRFGIILLWMGKGYSNR